MSARPFFFFFFFLSIFIFDKETELSICPPIAAAAAAMVTGRCKDRWIRGERKGIRRRRCVTWNWPNLESMCALTGAIPHHRGPQSGVLFVVCEQVFWSHHPPCHVQGHHFVCCTTRLPDVGFAKSKTTVAFVAEGIEEDGSMWAENRQKSDNTLIPRVPETQYNQTFLVETLVNTLCNYFTLWKIITSANIFIRNESKRDKIKAFRVSHLENFYTKVSLCGSLFTAPSPVCLRIKVTFIFSLHPGFFFDLTLNMLRAGWRLHQD